jgi:DNA modification methylase
MDFDLELTGFDLSDIDKFLDDASVGLKDDDEVPEAPSKPKSRLGDIWICGKHRVMCGDATDESTLNILMQDKKADLIFADPPYGMGKEIDGVLNDNLNYSALLDFNKKWVPLSFSVCKDNGSFYCWGTDEPIMDIYSNIIKPLIKSQKATFRNLVTWDKGVGQGQNSENHRMYPTADEKCIFVMMGVQGFDNNADNYFEGWEPVRDYLLQSRLAMGWDVPTMKRIVGHSDLSRDHWTSKSQFEFPTRDVYNKFRAEAERVRAETGNDAFKKEYDAFKKEYDELKKELYSTRAYFDNTHDNQNNVWHFPRVFGDEKLGCGGHATPKPVALCERAIKSSCPSYGLVLDPFCGSGSTMIAAEKTNRVCHTIDLSEKYVDVAVKRWQDYTGQDAINEKTGVKFNDT